MAATQPSSPLNRAGSTRIELDETHAEALRVLLDSAVRDLSFEIADTDLPSYRQMLRDRRTVLRQILDMVGGALPNAQWSSR